ncbi:MAG: TonB-dependent receptor [Tannerellaceae bacterium]|jgi:TonB-linked SusC/RagA family outer membrane protein|nr:TonB-dependent receptor [Tannerellaceae bacterium]
MIKNSFINKQNLRKSFITGIFLLSLIAGAVAQNIAVTGTVTDEAGDPLIGVNVLVKGTTTGAITDVDGKYNIPQATSRSVLVFSYVGFATQEIVVANQRSINVQMKDDARAIQEVVVVGYGTQAKKDITGSVAVVSTDDLKEVPVATFAEALQGRASGVYVSSSGAPGAPTTIRIRGVGSVNGSDPLIVVDGVSNVPIDAVNPNDIESLQVLKDASATAIYGAKGANGVIIITTRQGQKGGRVRIQYDGFGGVSTMANEGFDVLNGWEAMEFQAQGLVNLRDIKGVSSGLSHAQFGALKPDGTLTMPYAIKPAGLSREQVISQFGSIDAWIKSYKPNGANSWSRSAYYQMLEEGYSEEEARRGTDWYKEVVQSGAIQEHQLSILGGNDKGMYSMALGYSSREGTIVNSKFDRYSLRINSTFSPTKYLTLGQNTNLAAMEMKGERGFQGESTVYAKTYTMQSWVPKYNIGGDFAGSQAPESGRDITSIAAAYYQLYDKTRMFRGQTALFAELKPYAGLTLRTQYSARLSGSWDVNFNPITIMTNKEGSSNNSLEEQAQWYLDWQWTNTATYATKIQDVHNLTVVVGSEALNDDMGRRITAYRIGYTFEDDPNTHIIDNGASSNLSNSGYMNSHSTMFGLFGRADYSYAGKYLVTLSVRRDASSKFSQKNRWGTFPSASVGWRISDENFLASTRKWLDDLKFRAGYGTTGNSNIGAYNYAFRYATGNAYLYSVSGADTQVNAGYHISNLGDANAKWETVQSLNVGFDATAFNNKLTASVEWYTRKTTDMLVPANWSALAGNASKPQINIGDLINRGVDISLGWRDRKGDFRYSINANLSTYRNEVLKLGSSDLFVSTRLNNVSITTVGQPVGMFYGYNVIGIYKSTEDVLGYKVNGQTVLPYAESSLEGMNAQSIVGRYKIEDVNGDGRITAADRTIIGNPHPDFTGGVNLNLGYKNFDLATYFYYSVGNDLYKHYMFYTHYGALQSNYSKDRRDNSWHPTSNPDGVYPLWATVSQDKGEAATESNSMYVDDGSYLRMQTLTLGYSLPKNIIKHLGLDRIRLYGQVTNVFTVTKYPGLDPEVRTVNPDNSAQSYDRNKGVDFGSYGMPRQFIVGINLSF